MRENDPHNVYFYDDENIKKKQNELAEQLITDYTGDKSAKFNEFIDHIEKLIKLSAKDSRYDSKTDAEALKNAIESKDKVRVYDALSQIGMDLARHEVDGRLTNLFREDGEQ